MSAATRTGALLAGKYRVECVLGQGGMGVVVAAVHEQLGQRVAIKTLLDEASKDPHSVARFLQEARASVRLRGEHVARVIDVGTLDDGAPFLVMEYLEGADLAQVLRWRGPLPLAEAVDYVLQAAEAVAEAHAAGIVHRDLKPANLFLARGPDGTPTIKVLDFGISKMTGPADFGMTKTGVVLGSPYYMAPEQMRSSRRADVRSDVWAFGIILYEILTGRVAFEAQTLTELCAVVLTEAPPSLRARRADLPAGLDAVAARCLEKDPSARYGDLAALAHALAPFAPPHALVHVDRVARLLGRGGDARPSYERTVPLTAGAGVASGAGVAATSQSTHASLSVTSPPRRRRGFVAAVGAIGVLGLVGAGWFISSRSLARPAPPTVLAVLPTPALSALASVGAAPSPAAAPVAPPSVVVLPVTPAESAAVSAAAPAPVAKPRPAKSAPPAHPPPSDDPFGDSRK